MVFLKLILPVWTFFYNTLYVASDNFGLAIEQNEIVLHVSTFLNPTKMDYLVQSESKEVKKHKTICRNIGKRFLAKDVLLTKILLKQEVFYGLVRKTEWTATEEI